jgi:hypothetical protein
LFKKCLVLLLEQGLQNVIFFSPGEDHPPFWDFAIYHA